MTSFSSAEAASNHQSMSGLYASQKSTQDINRLKMAQTYGEIDQTSFGRNDSFKGFLGQQAANSHATGNTNPWDFSGGLKSQVQEYHFNQAMRAESSKGAFSQMLTPEDLDKEFKFLTNLIIEDFRDPDPTKEKDHTQQTLAMITMMSAGSQMQMSSNLQDLLKHMKQQSQMVIESRIGKKVQYRGDPVFEVASNDKTVPIRYRLGKDAAMGMARIYNDQGQLVHEIPLTKLTKGDHQITWDRLVKGSNRPIPEGMYTVDFNLMGRDGKRFNDGDYLFELEGVVSGIDRDDDGSPIYYVGGHPISGRITTISKASGEFEQLSSWFKDGPLTQLTSSKPIQAPVQPRTLAADSQMQSPLLDASKAMQQAASVQPIIDQLI